MRLSTKLLLFGDWHWLVRDPLDLLRLVFFAGALPFALLERRSAVGLAAASVLLLIARIVNLPRRLDLGVTVAIMVIVSGTSVEVGNVSDTVLHATTAIVFAPVLYVCLVRLNVLVHPGAARGARKHAAAAIWTVAIGMAVGAAYEVMEWASDLLLGTNLIESANDTAGDLVADAVGLLLASIFLIVWSVSGWASRRRTYRAVSPPDFGTWRTRVRRDPAR